MQIIGDTLMDSQYCQIFWNGADNILYILWKKGTTNMRPEQFKNHLYEFSSFVQKFQVANIFVDTSSCFFTIGISLQKWHDDVIVPKYLEGGLRKMAFLTAKDFYAQVSHEQTFQEEKSQALQVQFFDDDQRAKDWLLKN